MGDFGVVRSKRTKGRLYFYVELPGRRRLYSQRIGKARIPFTEESANRTLEAIRWHLANGKRIDEALALFEGENAPENQIRYKLDRWLEVKRREAKAGDISPTYLRELERYAKPGGHFSWWEGASIFQVRYAQLEDWGFWLDDRGLSAKTRWNVIAAFRSFLGWLYRREDLAELPRQIPWPKLEESVPDVLTAEAQAELLATIPEGDRGAFLAMALMGIRPGEVVALDLGDYADGWLTVKRARKGPRLDAPIRGTKTPKGWKRLPVPDELAEWLDDHREILARVAPSRGVSRARAVPQVPRAGAPLFPNPRTGDRWTPTSLRRVWSKACRAVGVEISLYEGTKHTFATDAAARKVPERALQAFLGHRDVRSTRRYAKLADGALLDVIRRKRP